MQFSLSLQLSKLKNHGIRMFNYYNSVAQHDLKLYVDGSAYAGSGRITSIYNNNSSTSSVNYGAWSIMYMQMQKHFSKNIWQVLPQKCVLVMALMCGLIILQQVTYFYI